MSQTWHDCLFNATREVPVLGLEMCDFHFDADVTCCSEWSLFPECTQDGKDTETVPQHGIKA